MIEFRLLGPVELRVDGAVVECGGPRQRGVLAALAIDAGRPVHTRTVMERVWGTQPPDRVEHTLYVYISRIRRLLAGAAGDASRPPVLVRRAGGYLLDVEADAVDLHRFRVLTDLAGEPSASAERSAALLRTALELWRGSPMADVPGEWADIVRAGWRQRHLTAVTAWAAAETRAGNVAAVTGPLSELAAQNPLEEPVNAALIRALHAAGRRADALSWYAATRARLVDELGVEPGPELSAAQRAVLTDRPTEQPETIRPARRRMTPAERLPGWPGPRPAPAQLPADVAGFTGREMLLAALHARLSAQTGQPAGVGTPPTALPVVVLSGPAGVGKTALATHWAHLVRDRFPDGQLHVDLGGFTPGVAALPPAAALTRFLRALGVPADEVPADPEAARDLFRSLLADRRLLVVLDNARSAEQVRALLPGGASGLVVVTSRDSLDGLVARDGAHRIPVELLPDAAMWTLLRFMLAGDARLDAEPDACGDLIRLCAGLPLALRIAAAGLAATPSEPVAALVRRLVAGDRLDTLAVDGDPLASVRPMLDASYRILPPPARRLFRLLGLVPGLDTDLDTAAALAGRTAAPVRRQLSTLVRLHLVTEPVHGRFALHDLLRVYARDRAERDEPAGERDAARRRLVTHYLALATAAAAAAYPHSARLPSGAPVGPPPFPTARAALAWIDSERTNLLAAVACTAGTAEAAMSWRLADALHGYFWIHRFPGDWMPAAQAALAAAERERNGEGLAAGHYIVGNAHRTLARHGMATAHLSIAVTRCRAIGWVAGECSVTGALAMSLAETGRLRQAEELIGRAVKLAQQQRDVASEASQLSTRGLIRINLGQLSGAADDLARAERLLRDSGSEVTAALMRTNQGWTHLFRGHFAESRDCFTTGLAHHVQTGHRLGAAVANAGLGELHAVTGDPATAIDHAREACELAAAAHDTRTGTVALIVLSHAYHAMGDPIRARNHADHAAERADRADNRYLLSVAHLALADAYLATDDACTAAAHARRSLAISGRDGYASVQGSAWTALAEAHLRHDRPLLARAAARLALASHRHTGSRPGEARTLAALADIRRLEMASSARSAPFPSR